MNGFPDYGSAVVGVDGCILKNPLTDGGNLSGGVAIGSPVFTDRGVVLGYTNGLRWNGVFGNLPQGTMSFTVNKSWFDKDQAVPVGNNILAQIRGGTNVQLIRDTSKYIRVTGTATLTIEGQQHRLELGSIGKPDRVRCDISWTQSGISVYLQHMIVLEANWLAGPNAPNGSDFLLGSTFTSQGPDPECLISDFTVYNRPIVVPISDRFANMVVGGDSIIMLGGYPRKYTGTEWHLARVWQIEDGVTGSDLGGGLHYDMGITPTIHRKLLRYHQAPGRRIREYSEASIGWQHSNGDGHNMPGRLANLVSGKYPIPREILLHVGTNDAADLAITVPGTLQATIQASIDALKAARDDINIHLGAVLGRTNANVRERIDAVNGIYQELSVINSGVEYVNGFDHMGGHDIPAEYLVDGVHLSDIGCVRLGEFYADHLLRAQ